MLQSKGHGSFEKNFIIFQTAPCYSLLTPLNKMPLTQDCNMRTVVTRPSGVPAPNCLGSKAANSSGIMSSVVWADGLAEVDIGQQVLEGDLLKVFPL